MGSIYSKAVEVITWLGLSQSMGRAFKCALELKTSSPKLDTIDKWCIQNRKSKGKLKEDWLTVIRDRYWSRAWITQEILLAKQIKIWVNDLEIEPHRVSDLAEEITYEIHGQDDYSKEWVDERDHHSKIFAFYIRHIGLRRGDIRKVNRVRKLITLFADLPGRQSYYIHDRVYSLLSIASDAINIKVDYRASPGELLNQLLEIYSTTMCLCSWFYITDMLNVQHIPDSKHGRNDRVPVFKIPMKSDQTQFVMTHDPKDWYHSCAECSKRMDSFDSKGDISFCIKPLCTKLKGGHLFVKKHRTGKYSIRRSDDPKSHEVLHFQPTKMEKDTDDDMLLGMGAPPGWYDIFLTGDVLIKLFVIRKPSLRVEVPLRICNKASSGVREIEFCENIWACGKGAELELQIEDDST
ncbi:hypothetical protein L13192_06788 [Pyrenophora tritici-repentis]|nr:hypothetical protein L13192_06788 [Pyrenophora tritici-repentis]